MSEATPGREVIISSTSAAATSPYEWDQFKATLLRPPTKVGSAQAVESADTIVVIGDRPSAGTAYTVQALYGRSERLPGVPDVTITPHPGAFVNVADRAYPHLLEAAQPAVSLIQHCLDDARLALDAFQDADFTGVATRLSAIAAQCSTAHSLTKFNESFGAVVSFIRRSAVSANAAEISRPALNAMINVLNHLTQNPMIGIGDAADMQIKLSDCGWIGEHEAVNNLLAWLLSEEGEAKTTTNTEI
jgi:hypothetical protein